MYIHNHTPRRRIKLEENGKKNCRMKKCRSKGQVEVKNVVWFLLLLACLIAASVLLLLLLSFVSLILAVVLLHIVFITPLLSIARSLSFSLSFSSCLVKLIIELCYNLLRFINQRYCLVRLYYNINITTTIIMRRNILAKWRDKRSKEVSSRFCVLFFV